MVHVGRSGKLSTRTCSGIERAVRDNDLAGGVWGKVIHLRAGAAAALVAPGDRPSSTHREASKSLRAGVWLALRVGYITWLTSKRRTLPPRQFPSGTETSHGHGTARMDAMLHFLSVPLRPGPFVILLGRLGPRSRERELRGTQCTRLRISAIMRLTSSSFLSVNCFPFVFSYFHFQGSGSHCDPLVPGKNRRAGLARGRGVKLGDENW
ncbi:hypothetical protein V8C44DRAFT_332030 [Trichoderma aethiopicum]